MSRSAEVDLNLSDLQYPYASKSTSRENAPRTDIIFNLAQKGMLFGMYALKRQ